MGKRFFRTESVTLVTFLSFVESNTRADVYLYLYSFSFVFALVFVLQENTDEYGQGAEGRCVDSLTDRARYNTQVQVHKHKCININTSADTQIQINITECR